jgi:hypothetical protein
MILIIFSVLILILILIFILIHVTNKKQIFIGGNDSTKSRGLKNIGQTCWLNSSIQLLNSFPNFKYLLNKIVSNVDISRFMSEDNKLQYLYIIKCLKNIIDLMAAEHPRRKILRTQNIYLKYKKEIKEIKKNQKKQKKKLDKRKKEIDEERAGADSEDSNIELLYNITHLNNLEEIKKGIDEEAKKQNKDLDKSILNLLIYNKLNELMTLLIPFGFVIGYQNEASAFIELILNLINELYDTSPFVIYSRDITITQLLQDNKECIILTGLKIESISTLILKNDFFEKNGDDRLILPNTINNCLHKNSEILINGYLSKMSEETKKQYGTNNFNELKGNTCTYDFKSDYKLDEIINSDPSDNIEDILSNGQKRFKIKQTIYGPPPINLIFTINLLNQVGGEKIVKTDINTEIDILGYKYKLCGYVVHSGDGNGGHYICEVLEDNKIVTYNDAFCSIRQLEKNIIEGNMNLLSVSFVKSFFKFFIRWPTYRHHFESSLNIRMAIAIKCVKCICMAIFVFQNI